MPICSSGGEVFVRFGRSPSMATNELMNTRKRVLRSSILVLGLAV